MRPYLLFVLVLCASLAHGGRPGFGQQTESFDQIRSEYLNALKKLEAQFATVQGSGTLTEERAMGSKNHQTEASRIEFARKPGMFMALRHDVNRTLHDASKPAGATPVTLPDTVRCYNKSMSFHLEKKVGANSFTLSSTGGTSLKEQSSISSLISKFMDSPYALIGPTVSNYLAKPGFIIEKVEPTILDHKNLLKIFFKYQQDNVPKVEAVRKARITWGLDSGWLLVSPEEGWIIYQEENDWTRPGGSTLVHSLSIDYDENRSGIPRPKRVQFERASRFPGDQKEMTLKDGTVVFSGALTERDVFEFDRFDFEEAADSTFTLPAFGLHDLGKQIAARGSITPWIFAVAFLALVLAIALRYYAVRGNGDDDATMWPRTKIGGNR